jgi:transcriptional regulator with XRE-family HTH domain
MTTPNETFAAWMKAERKRTGMSQDKLAVALQDRGVRISQSQIAKVERVEHGLPLEWAVAIADVFGASVDVALGIAAADADAQRLAALVGRRTSALYELKAAIAAELSVTS